MLRHPSAVAQGGNLELDASFLLRTPLWPTVVMDSAILGRDGCRSVRVLDLHEIAAGKMAALFARSAPRDVFDAVELLADPRIEDEKLRLGFVAYGAMSRKDWRGIRVEDIACDAGGFRNEVAVLLGGGVGREPIDPKAIEERCRALAERRLLPLREHEMEFLRLVNDEGIVVPRLLTPDAGVQAVLASHPGLLWKAGNARKRRDAPTG